MPRLRPGIKLQARKLFTRARRAETQYAVKLRRVAHAVTTIVREFNPLDAAELQAMQRALQEYGQLLGPWAERVASRMLADVDARDRQTWTQIAREMSSHLADEIANAPTGQVMTQLLSEQVTLIKSLPLTAAEQVHDLTLEGILRGGRSEDLFERIKALGDITDGRARVIARTEVSRTAANLTQARAQHVGSDSYIWRTARDPVVRASHRKMEAVVVSWSTPPTLDNLTGHAGCLPNCRCYAEPILPDISFGDED